MWAGFAVGFGFRPLGAVLFGVLTVADAWVLGHVHTPEVLSQDPFIGWVGMGKAVLVDVPSATITRL